MSAKAISEASGKRLLNNFLNGTAEVSHYVSVDESTSLDSLVAQHPWLKQQRLVVKPDQLIKRRGKLGLILVNADIDAVKNWISERISKNIQIGRSNGKLRNFIIEPFVPHKSEEEYYVCIHSHRNGDTILFHHEGGVEIGDVDSKALKLEIEVDETPDYNKIKTQLLKNVPEVKKDLVCKFIAQLYKVYVDLYFTYLEINPLG
ncbi:ATP-citrate synthase-like protein [Leptotrombidium deliense]|uniref:ATP-citrate synthase-like protein n=1 Tax=Leptotrombidium deliense TaxID=299467 RepID=A0A443S4S4_9ACAR|nr:ATP-citrate synthase-like protein [Leptotrombidium deliense]